MAALPHPHAEDLIIHREPAGTFTLSVSSSTPQIVCRTFEDALQRAGGFARGQHVRLWYTNDGLQCTPLGDVTLLRRIWIEYVEMPGLRLTPPQARRLWALDADTCTPLLDTLVALKLLMRHPDGKYARLVDLPMAKADLGPHPASGPVRHAG